MVSELFIRHWDNISNWTKMMLSFTSLTMETTLTTSTTSKNKLKTMQRVGDQLKEIFKSSSSSSSNHRFLPFMILDRTSFGEKKESWEPSPPAPFVLHQSSGYRRMNGLHSNEWNEWSSPEWKSSVEYFFARFDWWSRDQWRFNGRSKRCLTSSAPTRIKNFLSGTTFVDKK